jgi:uncharacterized damage-inducible protein DinB
MIPFNLNKSLELLERTPASLETLLSGLSDEWIYNNEGEETFSPYDVMGHLVHGETTDWVARTKKTLSENDKNFTVFDRFAMYEESKGKSIEDLLKEFKEQRKKNLDFIRSLNITEDMLDKKGIHPKFGEVTLRQLLSTWTVHDLGHMGQIVRVMAKQYKENVGPWVEYLRILKD